MCVDDDHVLRPDEYGGIAINPRLRMGPGEINAVRDLLNVKQVGIGTRSGSTSPRSAVVGKFQNGRPCQGAAHQDAKEVAARGMSIVGESMVMRM